MPVGVITSQFQFAGVSTASPHAFAGRGLGWPFPGRVRRGRTYSETDRTLAVSEADLLAGKVDPAIGGSCGPIPKDWAEHDGTPGGVGGDSCVTSSNLNAGHTPFIRRRTDSGILAHKDCCTSCWFPKLALRGRNSSQSLFLLPSLGHGRPRSIEGATHG